MLFFGVGLHWDFMFHYYGLLLCSTFAIHNCDPFLWPTFEVQILGWDIYTFVVDRSNFVIHFSFLIPFVIHYCDPLLWNTFAGQPLNTWKCCIIGGPISKWQMSLFFCLTWSTFVIQTDRHERWEMILKCHLIWSCSPF